MYSIVCRLTGWFSSPCNCRRVNSGISTSYSKASIFSVSVSPCKATSWPVILVIKEGVSDEAVCQSRFVARIECLQRLVTGKCTLSFAEVCHLQNVALLFALIARSITPRRPRNSEVLPEDRLFLDG